MKQILSISIFLMISSAFLFSCRDDTNMRKKITGKAGELVIVIPTETWAGEVGEAMRKVLAQAQLSLPQDEPIFDLIAIPPAAFKEIFKTSRNLINVRISPTLDSAKVEFKKDIWAWPQAVVNIQAASSDEFTRVFNSHSDRIVAYLLKAERDRLLMNYQKYNDKAVKNTLLKKFDIQLNVPPGFVVAGEGKDFTWVRYDSPEITQGISVYTFPYLSDSTFTLTYLLNKRDSVLKAHIEGPAKGSYMMTEHQLPPLFNVFQFKKNYAAEMRGLWRVENDFMGGPFVNLTVLDAANNRVVMLDGFVYAPRYDKRNYLRQVEAMLYSLELPDQGRNDKITSQINMGN
ncbi:DUF4837 family protein [Gaoshiqia sp. Z1-71]|uniref:DUF4837 family protein n=1 Tax=Gaoshiqia hydrogeniformans TaxID=3290090 RepID=UPI003BF8A8B1